MRCRCLQAGPQSTIQQTGPPKPAPTASQVQEWQLTLGLHTLAEVTHPYSSLRMCLKADDGAQALLDGMLAATLAMLFESVLTQAMHSVSSSFTLVQI